MAHDARPGAEQAPYSEAAILPEQLVEQRRWICWRRHWNAKTQKTDKLPVSCVTGYGKDFLKVENQVDYETASRFASDPRRRLAGVGFVLMGDGILGMDLDKCRDPVTGVIEPWAVEILGYGETYAEISPSGTGIRLFALGGVDELGGRTSARNVPAQVEIYVRDRYLTVTGDHVAGTPWDVCAAPRTVAALLDRAYPKKAKKTAGRAPAGTAKAKGKSKQRQPKNAAEAINQMALGNLDAWVPSLFPAAVKGAGNGWRVKSVDLGRALEEDLALHPQGIKDFGVHDMGDKREGKRVASEVVAEWGKSEGIKNEKEAVAWLAEKLGVDLDKLGQDTAREAFEDDDDGMGGKGRDALDDFYAFLPEHKYIYVPTRDLWPAASINATIKPIVMRDRLGVVELDDKGKPVTLKAATWLDQNKPVQQMTWWPGQALVVADKVMVDGGWDDKPGSTTFNLYRPPALRSGDAKQAGRWLDHVRKIYPNDAEHILKWLAHRVQKPEEKINHALVLGGMQGIGKDTILVPVREAVGPWNFAEVSPGQVGGRFNKFIKSVILRVSEARDRGDDTNRYAFYDHMKTLTAAPPDTLLVDEKNTPAYSVVNVCGVIFTTNDRLSGIYLPPNDRRHYVAWTNADPAAFDAAYWNGLYAWFEADGNKHVAAWLRELDILGFKAKAPPPRTQAFLDIVGLSQATEDAELADALDDLGNPDAVTIGDIAENEVKQGRQGLFNWLADRKNGRAIPHRMLTAGYVACHNPSDHGGRWRMKSGRQTIYVLDTLHEGDRIHAAESYQRSH